MSDDSIRMDLRDAFDAIRRPVPNLPSRCWAAVERSQTRPRPRARAFLSRPRHLLVAFAAAALVLTGLSVTFGGGLRTLALRPNLTAGSKQVPGTYHPPKNAPIASKTGPVVIPSSPPFVMPSPGIIDMHQGPFGAVDFTVENFWEGYVGSTWTLVYAGSDRLHATAPPGGGIPAVRLVTETFNSSGLTSSSNFTEFQDPSASGPLIITSVSGTVMEFTTPSGDQVHLNLLTHTFF